MGSATLVGLVTATRGLFESSKHKAATSRGEEHQDPENLSKSQSLFLRQAAIIGSILHRCLRNRSKHTIFCVLFLLIVLILPPFSTRKVVRRIDQHALDIWMDHVNTHPAMPEDRYGLSEMGFRASTYAELLRRGQGDFLPGLEESLWSFIHNPHTLRDSQDVDGFGARFRDRFMRRSVTHSRGIVMCVTTQTAQLAFAQIEAIHGVLQSSLRIEVFFYGPNELPKVLQQAFETLAGVSTYDLMTNGMFDESLLHHEDLDVAPRSARQALALLATNFTEIIYLEPETVLLHVPEKMFESKDFSKTGTLFFRQAQRFANSGGMRLLKMLRTQLDRDLPSQNLATSPFWNFEVDQYQSSGVALFDRSRPGVFVALLYNAWLHSAKPREGLWNLHFRDMTHEILWLAFELARIPYSFVGTSPGAVGYSNLNDMNDMKVCDPRPLHFYQQDRGSSEGSLPTWFEGPLIIDMKHDVYFRPDGLVRRGKWEPQQNQWCVLGSDPVPLSLVQQGNHTLSLIFNHLIDSHMQSMERYKGLLSYFSESA